MNQNNTILWAPFLWEHLGTHSGLAPLSRRLEALAPGLISPLAAERSLPAWQDKATRLSQRIAGVLNSGPDIPSIQRQAPSYGEGGWRLEQRILKTMVKDPPAAVMLESLEDQFFTLATARADFATTRLIGISHQPSAWWRLRSEGARHFQALDRLIVLSSETKTYWDQLLGADKVTFIPHGADTDFFVPSSSTAKPSEIDGILRVIFSGQWLRDFRTLAAVIKEVDKLEMPVHFELVVPLFARTHEDCYQIARSPRVRWHAGLDDAALRDLYQRSDLLLLTLQDCTANNSILEAMACGLPLIVTDVGGTRDYATESSTSFVPPGDAPGMVAALQSLISSKEDLKQRGRLAREHVETHFDWAKISQRYLQEFKDVLKGLPVDMESGRRRLSIPIDQT